MGKLTALKIARLQEPGRYHDGDGLMLNVTSNGSKSWLLRVQWQGRRRDIGLGSYKVFGLQAARERAFAMRQQMQAGIDPVLAKKAQVATTCFEQAAEALIAEQRASWRNAKHAAQWRSTLETYAFSTLAKVSVADITSPMVRDAVLPIWLEKPETARRLLQRIGAVLDWATAKGIRTTGMSTAAIRPAWVAASDRPGRAPSCHALRRVAGLYAQAGHLGLHDRTDRPALLDLDRLSLGRDSRCALVRTGSRQRPVDHSR